MLVLTIEAIVGWFVLTYISVNLLGFLVRGFFENPEINKLEQETTLSFIKDEIRRGKRADLAITILSAIFILCYFYLLFHFLNIFALIAALMLMISRFPDLLWEIKTGQKVKMSNLPKGTKYFIATFLSWASFPVIWWALYNL